MKRLEELRRGTEVALGPFTIPEPEWELQDAHVAGILGNRAIHVRNMRRVQGPRKWRQLEHQSKADRGEHRAATRRAICRDPGKRQRKQQREEHHQRNGIPGRHPCRRDDREDIGEAPMGPARMC